MLKKEITALHLASTETDFGEKGVKETKRCCGRARGTWRLHWFTRDHSFLPCFQPHSWCSDGHIQYGPGEGSWDEALFRMGRMSGRKNGCVQTHGPGFLSPHQQWPNEARAQFNSLWSMQKQVPSRRPSVLSQRVSMTDGIRSAREVLPSWWQ